MNQMQSLQEHLTELHDKLNAAAKTNDDDARKNINDALQHLEAAQKQLKTATGDRSAQIGAHLDALQEHASNAMNERGDSLQVRLHKMMTSCKSAIEQCIEEQTMTP